MKKAKITVTLFIGLTTENLAHVIHHISSHICRCSKMKVGDLVVVGKRYRQIFPRRKGVPGIVLNIKKRTVHGWGEVKVLWSNTGRVSLINRDYLEVISEL